MAGCGGGWGSCATSIVLQVVPLCIHSLMGPAVLCLQSGRKVCNTQMATPQHFSSRSTGQTHRKSNKICGDVRCCSRPPPPHNRAHLSAEHGSTSLRLGEEACMASVKQAFFVVNFGGQGINKIRFRKSDYQIKVNDSIDKILGFNPSVSPFQAW